MTAMSRIRGIYIPCHTNAGVMSCEFVLQCFAVVYGFDKNILVRDGIELSKADLL